MLRFSLKILQIFKKMKIIIIFAIFMIFTDLTFCVNFYFLLNKEKATKKWLRPFKKEWWFLKYVTKVQKNHFHTILLTKNLLHNKKNYTAIYLSYADIS